MVYAQNDGWHISTQNNEEPYAGIAMSNGIIGIWTSAEPFRIKHTVLNKLYDVDPILKLSQIVHGMDFGNLDVIIGGEQVTSINSVNWSQTIERKMVLLGN